MWLSFLFDADKLWTCSKTRTRFTQACYMQACILIVLSCRFRQKFTSNTFVENLSLSQLRWQLPRQREPLAKQMKCVSRKRSNSPSKEFCFAKKQNENQGLVATKALFVHSARTFPSRWWQVYVCPFQTFFPIPLGSVCLLMGSFGRSAPQDDIFFPIPWK